QDWYSGRASVRAGPPDRTGAPEPVEEGRYRPAGSTDGVGRGAEGAAGWHLRPELDLQHQPTRSRYVPERWTQQVRPELGQVQQPADGRADREGAEYDRPRYAQADLCGCPAPVRDGA